MRELRAHQLRTIRMRLLVILSAAFLCSCPAIAQPNHALTTTFLERMHRQVVILRRACGQNQDQHEQQQDCAISRMSEFDSEYRTQALLDTLERFDGIDSAKIWFAVDPYLSERDKVFGKVLPETGFYKLRASLSLFLH